MNPDWNSPFPSLLSYPISTPASTKEVASGVLQGASWTVRYPPEEW